MPQSHSPIDKLPLWKRKAFRTRVGVYGSLIGLGWGFMAFQPMAFDLFPKAAPKNVARVELKSLPLTVPRTRVAVVVGHPDDAEYYVAGTLLALAKAKLDVKLFVLTDGDKGYYPWENAAQNRRIRRGEQDKATSSYSSNPVAYLGFRDGRLQEDKEVQEALDQALREYRPHIVMAFDPVFPPRVSHQDHRRSGSVAVRSANKIDSVRWLLLFSTRAPNLTFPVDHDWEKRLDLLAIHKSQFAGEKLQRVQATITDIAIEAAAGTQATYAEAYRAIRIKRPG